MAFATGISYRDWVVLSDVYSVFSVQAKSGTTLLTSIDHVKTPRLKEVTRISGSSGTIQILFNSDADGVNPVNYRNAMEIGCIYVGGILPNGSTSNNSVQTDVRLYNSSGTLVESAYQLTGHQGNPYKYKKSDDAIFIFNDEIEDITRVEIDIDGFTASSIDIGRIWVGNWLNLNFDSDWSTGTVTQKNVNFSKGVDAHPLHTNKRKRGKFPITCINHETAYGKVNTVSASAINSVYDASLQCGTNSEIIILYRLNTFGELYPHRESFYGLLTKEIEISHQGGDYFETQIDVLELI